MKIKLLFAAAASLLALPATLSAQDAEALIADHSKKAAAALEAYLQANPDAEDAGVAIDFLIDSYARLGIGERQAELLQLKYDALPKGADLSPAEFFSVFQDLFALYVGNGDKPKAKAALADARRDIAGHLQAERFGKFIDQLGSELKTPVVGDSMEIKFTSLAGAEVDLAALKGKVVLVDFWATWRKPCVAELPNVKKAYTEFHDKGFEVIGISLDNAADKEKLENFIQDQAIPWPQAFDGKGWGTELAKRYGIRSIPATFLVGKDGKIVDTNLRGAALSNAIKKALGG